MTGSGMIAQRFVRPQSGTSPASPASEAGLSCLLLSSFGLPLRSRFQIGLRTPRGDRRFCLAAFRGASKLPVCLFVAAQGMVMSSHFTFSQVARRWADTIRISWFRWQSSVARLYSRRVTQPVRLWKALGQPSDCMPRLPWWQSIVYKYLVISGWLPFRRTKKGR